MLIYIFMNFDLFMQCHVITCVRFIDGPYNSYCNKLKFQLEFDHHKVLVQTLSFVKSIFFRFLGGGVWWGGMGWVWLDFYFSVVG